MYWGECNIRGTRGGAFFEGRRLLSHSLPRGSSLYINLNPSFRDWTETLLAGLGLKVSDVGLGTYGLGFRIWGLRFEWRVEDLGVGA